MKDNNELETQNTDEAKKENEEITVEQNDKNIENRVDEEEKTGENENQEESDGDSVDNEDDGEKKELKEENSEVEIKEKKKRSIFKRTLGSINPLTGLLLLISIFGLVLFFNVKDQIEDNNIKLQKDIVESAHYVDLYEATGDDRYVILLYGELRNIDTLLRQTTHLSIAYPSLFITTTKADLLIVVNSHLNNLEEVINYEKQLNPKELIDLRTKLTSVAQEANGVSSFKTFLKETNKALK